MMLAPGTKAYRQVNRPMLVQSTEGLSRLTG